MITHFNSHKKIYVLATVFLVAVLGMVFGLIYPIMGGIKQGAKDMVVTKDQILHAAEQQQELADFSKAFESYKPNLETLDRSFVDAADPIDFIAFLESTASQSAVGIDIKLLPAQAITGAGPSQITFLVSLDGSFNGINSFVSRVERGPYLVSAQKLVMQQQARDFLKPEAMANSNLITANLVLQAMVKTR